MSAPAFKMGCGSGPPSVPEHVKRIRCPQGCHDLVLVEYLQNHLRYVCRHRYVVCEQCGKSIVIRFKPEHDLECSRLLIKCPNGCPESGHIPREELEKHLQVCKMKCKICKYEYLGCDFRGNKQDLSKHENNMYKHFKLIADVLSMLSVQFDVLVQNTKGDVLLLQNENVAFREGLKEVLFQFEQIRDENESLARKVESLQACMQNLRTAKEIDGAGDVFKDARDVITETPTAERRSSSSSSSSIIGLRDNLSHPPPVDQPLIAMVEHLRGKIAAQEGIIDRLSVGVHSDGVLLWKITGYARLKADALSGRRLWFGSEKFFTDRYGYKVYVKAFLGGDGAGRGSHLSLFVCILRGPWDNILQWPFRRRITFRLLDQRNVDIVNKQDVVETFVPNPNLVSFQKPQNAANVGSGIAKFAAHAIVERSGKYLMDDTIFVKVTVNPPGEERRRV